jgi:hypothetical protein
MTILNKLNMQIYSDKTTADELYGSAPELIIKLLLHYVYKEFITCSTSRSAAALSINMLPSLWGH